MTKKISIMNYRTDINKRIYATKCELCNKYKLINNMIKDCRANRISLISGVILVLLMFVGCSNTPSDEYFEHVEITQGYIDSMDYEAALEEIEHTMEINDKAPESYLQKGYLSLLMGDYEGALENLTYAYDNKSKFSEENNSYQAVLNIGNLYYQIGEYNEALIYFKEALEENSNDAELYNAIGLVYNQLGDASMAKEYYTLAIDTDQNSFYAYGNLAGMFLESGDYDRALNEINTALNLNAYVPAFYLIKANIYEAQEDFLQAESIYTQAIGMWDSYGDAYFLRGELRLHEGDYLGAVEDYSEAKDYGIIDGLFGMGVAFQGLEQYDDSITAFVEYLVNLEAIDLKAVYHMAVSYYQLGNYDEVINSIDELLTYEPEDTEALLLKALAYERMMQYDQAKIVLEEILQINPEHEEALKELEALN